MIVCCYVFYSILCWWDNYRRTIDLFKCHLLFVGWGCCIVVLCCSVGGFISSSSGGFVVILSFVVLCVMLIGWLLLLGL